MAHFYSQNREVFYPEDGYDIFLRNIHRRLLDYYILDGTNLQCYVRFEVLTEVTLIMPSSGMLRRVTPVRTDVS
jgi:hypothetical protein